MRKVALVLTAAALAFGVVGPAQAMTTNVRHSYVYYDSAEGNIVGYYIYYCDDTVGWSGYITPFYTEEHSDC
jgi:hypothetical protein